MVEKNKVQTKINREYLRVCTIVHYTISCMIALLLLKSDCVLWAKNIKFLTQCIKAANSIDFYSSSAYFGKSEFSNLIHEFEFAYDIKFFRVQADKDAKSTFRLNRSLFVSTMLVF